MCPRRLQQVPLYLEPEDVTLLDRLAMEAKDTKQNFLREAVTDLFVKYRAKGMLAHKVAEESEIDTEEMRKALAREVRAGAAIDVEALITSGDLIRNGRGWYVLRALSVLPKVSILVKALEHREIRGRPTEIRVQLESTKKYKELAARLKPGC